MLRIFALVKKTFKKNNKKRTFHQNQFRTINFWSNCHNIAFIEWLFCNNLLCKIAAKTEQKLKATEEEKERITKEKDDTIAEIQERIRTMEHSFEVMLHVSQAKACDLGGYCTSYPQKAPKLACFVLYLKIIAIFLKNNKCIL